MIKHWVGLSGGIDSIVLLHFLASHFPDLSLQAVHVNHQLLPEANQFEHHCKIFCQSLNIPLTIKRVSIIKRKGDSLEALAREARYTVFKNLIKKNDILFTAHHLDDQAETVLLQLLRGAGLRGVSAMPAMIPFKQGFLIRPFLSFTQADLQKYAQHHHLKWIDDPSNADTLFDRNYLRHQLFPLLQKRWPNAPQTLARFANHCATQEHILRETAKADFMLCHGEPLNTLYIPKLLKLDTARQQNVLRFYLDMLGYPSPSEKLLQELHNLFHAKQDAKPVIHWQQIDFRRYQHHLYICPKKRAQQALSTDEKNWCEQYLPVQLNHPSISIQYRRGGERFRPKGKKQSRELKKLFQEWKIPPWQRASIPLVYYHDNLIAVVGYDIGELNESSND